MTRKPNPKRNAKADKQRHLKNVQASDARERDTGLVRIAIWVPLGNSGSLPKLPFKPTPSPQ